LSASNHVSLRSMIYAALFGALTAIGAFIVIPLQPVPITLQSLFTCLAGILLGSSVGAMSQIVYVLLGIIGLPVFAGGKAGIGVLLGPTGGYLLGFIAAALVIGQIVRMKRNPGLLWLILALVAGNLAIYLLGITQLILTTHLSVYQALIIGLLPFLPGDIFKLAAAAWLARMLYQYFPFGRQAS
jgi:biotin transport system substrate-specific component